MSEKDGLSNNDVNDILEDRQGHFWFATHHGGVSRYDGQSFSNFTADGVIAGGEAWSLYEDRDGNIWFPTEGFGIYRYDGQSFTNFSEEEGLPSQAIQCIHQDRAGRIWLGGWMGLFRLDGDLIVQVGQEGPWE